MKRRVRGLANNKSKWYILDNGDVLFTPSSRLSYHIFKTKEAILKEVQHFNDLNDKIILNHTYDENDFAVIRMFKEEQLPAVHVPTDEDYRRVEYLYIKSKLTLQEVDELQDECIRRDIRFDMSRINP
ncbi:unnamed protein product [Rhizophagus irregularis]|nr:unnamed protein product [Rhizophagus irregularis]